MVQLGATCRHFFLGTTICDDGTLGTKTLCRTDGVHGNVAAAKDDDRLAVLGRGVILREVISLHEVNAGEILVCEEDVGEVLTWDVQKFWQTCAGCDVNGIEALLEKFVGISNATYN